MKTWNPRLDVVEALEEAGWTGDPDNPLGLLRCNGAVWGVHSDEGASSLTEPAAGETIEFPSGTPSELIVAACLAAAEQADDLVHKNGRLHLAWESAKRRAKRRRPHEREGLIFHLERQNKQLAGFAGLANQAAQASNMSWSEARDEVQRLRERNGELLARIDRLMERLHNAAEFRLPPVPPNFTPLIVRLDPAYDGTQWAVLHDPGDSMVRRAWTPDGWQMAWSLAHDETYCWPDPETARAQAKRAQAEDDREPDVDGAGRTRESYSDTPTGTTAP
ncbi:hypothetical protein AQJ30_15780 [Streptomyces longwoodensis]|uniref:Uncharacterized protein n=1 Tax=Streptomyces longwoodensis TaxID=68231 RepID=A0A101QXG4_9ACTN|nr:hypothetical protein [Streptomyces longwoodensis]KUN37742.1 hypothetical protein AQJ30_15780 [Streptomyces longwoodensis]